MTGKLNPETPEDDEDENPTIGGGTFTQEQVNTLVRDRLARQRRSLEAQYSAKISAGEDALKQIEELKGKAAKYDEIFKKGLEDRRKKLPESVLKLLDKLEPAEQLAWLDENADKITPVTPDPGPTTPKPKNGALTPEDVVEHKKQSWNYSL